MTPAERERIAERDGRRVSSALIEARTVLSRAETALHMLDRVPSDPATPIIRAALEELVERLNPFTRVRGGCPECGKPGKPHKHPTRHYAFTCERPRG